ncbi:MAG: VWA domain-containing protein, partial [Candidatus Riesia sp.]|nr:VWA domain-containing protein [Candidatus Riesia sp.]
MSDQFLEIVFSFDTTGSMSPCLQFLRKKLQASIGRLFRDVPNLRIGIVAHGDYEDARYTYVTKQYPLTTAYSKLEEFVQSVKSTNGYDFDECYEFVLHEVQKYNWLPGSKRILVMLGDAHPHMPSYCHNTLNLDWKAETKKLVDMGVSVYAIKCLDHNTKNFWEALAKVGKGKFIELEELSDISDLVMGIVLSQTGQLEEYVKELETAGTMTRSVSKLYSSLREV